jgi:hypothetical protein
VPTGVTVSGSSISWDDSPYALLWAVCKDGQVVAFTSQPTYEATKLGSYTLRAANEMGGLSKQAATVVIGADAIDSVQATAQAKASAAYNLAGQQVSDSYKGIVIQNGKKLMK